MITAIICVVYSCSGFAKSPETPGAAPTQRRQRGSRRGRARSRAGPPRSSLHFSSSGGSAASYTPAANHRSSSLLRTFRRPLTPPLSSSVSGRRRVTRLSICCHMGCTSSSPLIGGGAPAPAPAAAAAPCASSPAATASAIRRCWSRFQRAVASVAVPSVLPRGGARRRRALLFFAISRW